MADRYKVTFRDERGLPIGDPLPYGLTEREAIAWAHRHHDGHPFVLVRSRGRGWEIICESVEDSGASAA